jgi:hypothetical protein
MALGSTQRVTEMSSRNFPGGKGWLACMADKLTAVCEALASILNLMGLHGLLQG